MALLQAEVTNRSWMTREPSSKAKPVAEIRNLQVGFRTDEGSFNVLDGVSFTVRSGRTLCLVGESGCGKSVTALSIMGLLAPTGACRTRRNPSGRHRYPEAGPQGP